jgi:hypothetical protein
MTHLSNPEMLSAADGETAHAAHLGSCESCRVRVDALRQIVGLTRGVEVPEPSPLFWDHFSARVREAVAQEPRPAREWWARLGLGWAPSLVGALAIIVIGLALTMRTGQPMPAVPTQVEVAQTELDQLASVDALSNDATWEFMGDLTSQMEWDAAVEAGLIAQPGSAERALDGMSYEEQRLVVELLEQEIQKSKSL